ncbi:MAG: class I SAM-dependent methyltransferase [Bacteroidetes bacterium]|nr:class I SAM-dependent methyltransferase [Bacteroidota bacterium]
MIPALRNIRKRLFQPVVIEKNSADAYNLWSENYDTQPGNLMLDLDEVLFPILLNRTIIQNKSVADIGCGTGRHWIKILQMQPAGLIGFDVSEGMLNKLKAKFLSANTYKINDNSLSNVQNAAFDTIISTLTVAHIENIEQALLAWCRILKPSADVIITDFHPQLLAFGGKRTFKHHNERLAVKNYVHTVGTIKDLFYQNGFRLIREEEMIIDETVEHYYADQNALSVYEQFKGFPVIYGIHLRRGNDPEQC